LECHAKGLLRGFPPLSPTPATNSDPHVPTSPQNNLQIHIPPVDKRVFEEYQALKRNIGLAEWEILAPVWKKEAHRTEVSRQVLIARIAVAGFHSA
jgi:hypothetical protein